MRTRDRRQTEKGGFPRSIPIRLLAATLTFMSVAAICFAVPDSANEGRSGVGGSTGGKVSPERDLGFIGYRVAGPSGKSSSASAGETPRRIWTSSPATFDREGVYVWKGPDEVWNVVLAATNTVVANVAITSDGEIIPVKQSGDGRKAAKTMTTALSSAPGSKALKTQFKTTGMAIEFEILVDGHLDTSRVFIGRAKASPRASPFHLTSAPVTEPHGKAKVGTAIVPKALGSGQAGVGAEDYSDGRSEGSEKAR